MALLDEIATVLSSATGLTVGTALFKVPFPENSPDQSICIIEYGGGAAIRNHGASVSAPVAERVRFQVQAREGLNYYSTGRALIETAKNALDSLVGTLGSTRYLMVKVLGPPIYMAEDGTARHKWAINVEALKER
jgi:hypothetical protein